MPDLIRMDCIRRWGAIILALIAITIPSIVVAQQADPNAAGAKAAPAKISPAAAEKLVKYAIIAVDQGNKTGNYSVLRELCSPNFQATTSTAGFADAFAPLRKAHIDMSGLVMKQPQMQQPVIEKGFLRITGFFPSAPVRINFRISYTLINGQPRIAGLAINPVKATANADTTTKSNKVDKTSEQQQ